MSVSADEKEEIFLSSFTDTYVLSQRCFTSELFSACFVWQIFGLDLWHECLRSDRTSTGPFLWPDTTQPDGYNVANNGWNEATCASSCYKITFLSTNVRLKANLTGDTFKKNHPNDCICHSHLAERTFSVHKNFAVVINTIQRILHLWNLQRGVASCFWEDFTEWHAGGYGVKHWERWGSQSGAQQPNDTLIKLLDDWHHIPVERKNKMTWQQKRKEGNGKRKMINEWPGEVNLWEENRIKSLLLSLYRSMKWWRTFSIKSLSTSSSIFKLSVIMGNIVSAAQFDLLKHV